MTRTWAALSYEWLLTNDNDLRKKTTYATIKHEDNQMTNIYININRITVFCRFYMVDFIIL